MAPIINVNRWQNKLRALIGVRGENPIPTLSPALTPVVVLEDDRVEWGFAGGDFIFGYFASQAAVVGEQGFMGLVNPAGSGIIAVVDLFMSVQVAHIYIAGLAQVPIVGQTAFLQGNGFLRDVREEGQNAACGRSSGSSAAPPWLGPIGRILANAERRINVVLPSGTGVLIVGIAANTQLDSGMTWRERAQERGKLS